jgi:hypothetical protein
MIFRGRRGRQMPLCTATCLLQYADAQWSAAVWVRARSEPHIHACDRRRDFEVIVGDLPRLAPFWIRFDARLNDDQNCGMPFTSVAGALRNDGSLIARDGSCGPGSVSALGLVTLTAPSAG